MFSKTASNANAIQRLKEERAKAVRKITVLKRELPSDKWTVYKVAMSASEAMAYCDELWDAGFQAKTEEG